MLAFGLSILLFVFWAVIGYSVLALLHKQDNLLRNMLLAPVVGVATTLLPIFWLNRAGIPVAHFGKFLAVALLVTSIGLLWHLRPKLPWHDYLPFTGIFLLALFLTGRPMLEFGFDWASYTNADMTTYYSLSAHRFLNHGYFDPPNAYFANGLDYTFSVWGLLSQGHRTGSDLLLAWVVSLTNLMAPQVCMSVILAFHLVLISTAGALVCQSNLFRLAALLTCGLLSLSALTSLSTLYQLLAQVSGLGLLAGCATLLLRPFKGMERQAEARQAILAGILISGLLIVYPEVSPFLVLAFFLYILVGLIQHRLTWKPLLPVIGTVFLVTILAVNTYLLDLIRFFNSTTSTKVLKSVSLQENVFPYYLVPSGFANFWGMQSIAKLPPEPWLSISIALGGLLLLTGSIAALLLIRSGQPTAIMTTVMLGLGLLLFIRKNDFGLFKLVMFVQPFMIGTLVIAWLALVRHRSVKILPLFLLSLLNLPTQFSYVETSRGAGSGLVEIPNASASRIYTEFQQLISSTTSQNLLLNTSNPSLVGIQALYTRGKVAVFPSLSFLRKENVSLNFDLRDKPNRATENKFIKNDMTLEQSVTSSSDALVIATTPQQGLFNRWHFNPAISNNFVTQPLSKVRNQLIFIRSQLGKHYYTGDNFGSSSQASFYQLEPDFFLPGHTIAGIGRYFLFQVLKPSEETRLVLNMTASLKNDGENQLPPAAAIGAKRLNFPIIGRGSARVFSPPLTPQVIAGQTYLSIDMGVDGQTSANRKTGLMKLYGTDISTDQRRLVGYGRDISLVSDEEYANLAPLNNLSTFPADLTNPNLEYSGLYEDGWVSEAAFFGLTQPNTSSHLTVRGMIPKITDPTFISELRVLVDDQEVAKQILKPGEFDIKVKVPQGNRRRIDLRFSKFQRLQAPDNRPVAAKLKFIGFANENN